MLKHLTDEHIFSRIVGDLLEPELEKTRTSLLDKLDELTFYIKRGHPIPVGKSFLVRIQQARRDRELQRFRSALGKPIDRDTELAFSELEDAFSNLRIRADEHAAAEIIDEMEAYYETAIVTFVDNVATLAIENCLLRPLDQMFTSQTINNMKDEEVQQLAAEPSYILEERERLSGELAKLQAGLRAFGPFNIHPPSMPPFGSKAKPPSTSSDSASSGQESFTPPKRSFSSLSPSVTSSASEPLSESETHPESLFKNSKMSQEKPIPMFSSAFSKPAATSSRFTFQPGRTGPSNATQSPSTKFFNS